jgi:hypothetical protein
MSTFHNKKSCACHNEFQERTSLSQIPSFFYSRVPEEGGFEPSNIGFISRSREYLRGKYHCTVDLLFDWFEISCMTTDNACFYLQNRLIRTS